MKKDEILLDQRVLPYSLGEALTRLRYSLEFGKKMERTYHLCSSKVVNFLIDLSLNSLNLLFNSSLLIIKSYYYQSSFIRINYFFTSSNLSF